MSDERDDQPDTSDKPKEPTMTDDSLPGEETPMGEIIHFNPWRDFNDALPIEDPFGIEPDRQQIATFLDVVFGYCEGLIPVRGFIDKGQGFNGKPHNIWIDADATAADKLATFATWAWREGAAAYVIPGTVTENGQARAADVVQMQAIVVDLDAGEILAKLRHLVEYLGSPTLLIESGGRTPEGAMKLHVWWRLTEPATGEELAALCRIRGDIAWKVGGDSHFRSAHQPIRVAGSVYHKGGFQRIVTILEHRPALELELRDFAERVDAMPLFAGAGRDPVSAPDKPSLSDVLTTPVHEGGGDEWTRFAGASAAIGHYVRMVHEGRMSPDAGWEAICQYNAAVLRPVWALERLRLEADRLWARHIEKNGPPLLRIEAASLAPSSIPVFSFGALLDDASPMPADIIAPRVLTPGGLLVLGGAPKVGKSDFLISLLVHMAAGTPFLGFTPPRPMRVFYLQAEIQYHYLRERMQAIHLDSVVRDAARENLFATPKLKLILNDGGLAAVVGAVRQQFQAAPPDIICLDPIRNLFDGGPDGGGGENDNTAMMFFLTARIEALREAVAPDCGVILAHHTKKMNRKLVAEDPFQALSGASALRGFYTSGLIMHRPDEDDTARKLEIELRNGPAMRPKLIDKINGQWVELNPMNERLVRKEMGAKLDAERLRKHDVILGMVFDEAAAGRLYTIMQFAEAFENTGGLGSKHTIRDRLSVLATKGFVKFRRDGAAFGYPVVRSRYGYLCVEGMMFPPLDAVDEATGEITVTLRPVLPSHYKCTQSGVCLDVENPAVWVYPEASGDDLTPQE
ncbi:MAG: AAA family ATPase [Beijerinckiaceae bacterium]|nr:AAA family ATPase [Beijerinckiaceae bacterium]